jgi:hypothetical protein
VVLLHGGFEYELSVHVGRVKPEGRCAALGGVRDGSGGEGKGRRRRRWSKVWKVAKALLKTNERPALSAKVEESTREQREPPCGRLPTSTKKSRGRHSTLQKNAHLPFFRSLSTCNLMPWSSRCLWLFVELWFS